MSSTRTAVHKRMILNDYNNNNRHYKHINKLLRIDAIHYYYTVM